MDFPTAENEKDEDPYATVEVSCDYCVLRKAYTHALTVGCIFLFPFIYKMELCSLASGAWLTQENDGTKQEELLKSHSCAVGMRVSSSEDGCTGIITSIKMGKFCVHAPRVLIDELSNEQLAHR